MRRMHGPFFLFTTVWRAATFVVGYVRTVFFSHILSFFVTRLGVLIPSNLSPKNAGAVLKGLHAPWVAL